MSDPILLKKAESPTKARFLELVDEVRQEIEPGRCLSLVLIPLFTELKFDVRSLKAYQQAQQQSYYPGSGVVNAAQSPAPVPSASSFLLSRLEATALQSQQLLARARAIADQHLGMMAEPAAKDAPSPPASDVTFLRTNEILDSIGHALDGLGHQLERLETI